MQLIDIIDIRKKDLPVHYRHVYQATALFSYRGNELRTRLEFVLEQTAIGSTDLHVSFIDDPDYPLIPILKQVKEKVRSLESDRELPDVTVEP